MTAIRPAVRDVLRGVVIAAMVLLIGGTTLALRAMADDTPYILTRDGIQLAQPFEDNGHLNIRTDAGATFNIHAESKCITRTDAECAGQRHEVAQYIGATFIPWSAIGIPDDACVVWVQRSGANYHYGEHGEPAFCLTEEEPCPTETPSTTPTTPTEPTSTPTEEPSTSPSETPTETPSTTPTPEPSSSASTTPTTQPSASTDPTPTSAVLSQSDTATDARSADTTPTTDPNARDVLASSGLPGWWIAYAVIVAAAAIGFGAWFMHLVHPKRGDE